MKAADLHHVRSDASVFLVVKLVGSDGVIADIVSAHPTFNIAFATAVAFNARSGSDVVRYVVKTPF